MRGGEEQRLVAAVAWMYHTRGVRQSAIADRMRISQSRVSRLLERAVDLDIVRTVVALPTDGQSQLEAELQSAYGLTRADVFDIGTVTDEAQLALELGQLAALQWQATPPAAQVIGFTSWSRALQAMVQHLRPLPGTGTRLVVEMLGDLGPPTLQHHAAHHTQRLATLTGAEPVFLRVPGVLPHIEAKRTLLAHDAHARHVLGQLDDIDLALVGIGSADVVAPLQACDNYLTTAQLAQARARGAVGEVNLRFIAGNGGLVGTDVDDLIVGASVEQLRRPPRRLAVAGGPSKYRAVRAALLGGWVNELITDSGTARWLLTHRDQHE